MQFDSLGNIYLIEQNSPGYIYLLKSDTATRLQEDIFYNSFFAFPNMLTFGKGKNYIYKPSDFGSYGEGIFLFEGNQKVLFYSSDSTSLINGNIVETFYCADDTYYLLTDFPILHPSTVLCLKDNQLSSFDLSNISKSKLQNCVRAFSVNDSNCYILDSKNLLNLYKAGHINQIDLGITESDSIAWTNPSINGTYSVATKDGKLYYLNSQGNIELTDVFADIPFFDNDSLFYKDKYFKPTFNLHFSDHTGNQWFVFELRNRNSNIYKTFYFIKTADNQWIDFKLPHQNQDSGLMFDIISRSDAVYILIKADNAIYKITDPTTSIEDVVIRIPAYIKRIYPNPLGQNSVVEFYSENSDINNISFAIYSTEGIKLADLNSGIEYDYNSNIGRLSLQNLNIPNGSYFLVLDNGTKLKAWMFVKL
jgi:hypothetical protein